MTPVRTTVASTEAMPGREPMMVSGMIVSARLMSAWVTPLRATVASNEATPGREPKQPRISPCEATIANDGTAGDMTTFASRSSNAEAAAATFGRARNGIPLREGDESSVGGARDGAAFRGARDGAASRDGDESSVGGTRDGAAFSGARDGAASRDGDESSVGGARDGAAFSGARDGAAPRDGDESSVGGARNGAAFSAARDGAAPQYGGCRERDSASGATAGAITLYASSSSHMKACRVPNNLHTWCEERSISLDVEPMSAGMEFLFASGCAVKSAFLTTAIKLALLRLKTETVVRLMEDMHQRGEIVVSDGRLFVPEHAACEWLWQRCNESVITIGAAGTGKTVNWMKLLSEMSVPERVGSTGNTWVQVSTLKKGLLNASGADALIANVRTRAATFNTGRSDDLPDPNTQGTSEKSRVTLQCDQMFADELGQWAPGYVKCGYVVTATSRAHRRVVGRMAVGRDGWVRAVACHPEPCEVREGEKAWGVAGDGGSV